MKSINKFFYSFIILRDYFRFTKNFIFSFNFFFTSKSKLNQSNKILAIYDTTQQPIAVGDFIVFMQGAMLEKIYKNKSKLDIVIFYNNDKLDVADKVFRGHLNKSNIINHIQTLKNLANTFNFNGSLYIINSPRVFNGLILQNKNSLWPNYFDYLAKIYIPRIVFNNQLFNNKKFDKRNFLRPKNTLNLWARDFIKKNSGNKFSITINIRNNHNWGQKRNSNIGEWIKFIKLCNAKYNFHFFIICADNEIDNRFRRFKNLTLVKDYNTSISQDISLMWNSDFHMGTNSGPMSLLHLSEKPYVFFNSNLSVDHRYFCNKKMVISCGKNINRFWFSSKRQRVVKLPEDSILMLKELDFFLMKTNAQY